jgi:hypothetical protein
MKGVMLRGGKIERNEADVKVTVPKVDLSQQALISGIGPRAVLLGKERDPDIALLCSKGCGSTDIVVVVEYVNQDGHDLRFCRDCMNNRAPGKPLKISLSG